MKGELLKENDRFEEKDYLQFWQGLLREFFGWNAIEVQEWANRIPEYSYLEINIFRSKSPSYYILHLMIPGKIVNTLAVDLFDLRNEIQKAIDSCGDYSDSKFDFQMAKNNVIEILKRHNTSLPIYEHKILPDEEFIKRSKPYYLWFWWKILEEILGWNKEEVISWARQYKDGLNGIDEWFHHELPSYYVTPLFVPDELKKRLVGMELPTLYNCLEQKIKSNVDCFKQEFDFVRINKEVQKVLTDYCSS